MNPGLSQQTNKRIKEKFLGYIKNRFKIELEIFHFEKIRIEDFTLTNEDLYAKHVRRFIEESMIIMYKKKEYQILNL